MAPTPVNLTASGAGPKPLPPAAPAVPAAPHLPEPGSPYLVPAPAGPRSRYPPTQPAAETHGYQYHAYAVNPPPVPRKVPPIPPYPGTEHLYNYPVDPMVTKDGDVVIPPGPPQPGGAAIVVRAEEALLVLLVLVLWVAAIALFFNRWGKIRMLEPYQPKFQQHRQSCALVDISGTTQKEQNAIRFRRSSSKRKDEMLDCHKIHHRLSKLNLHALGEPVMLTGPPGPAARAQLLRPRQNSVFVGASPAMLAAQVDPPRKVKSAMDLQTLVLSEHEPGMAGMAGMGATASASSMLPSCALSPGLAGMRRASHVPIGSVRHHASFSHASFSDGPSCSYRTAERSPGVGPTGPERLASIDRYSNV